MERPILTKEYLLSIFDYKDGFLYWKGRPRFHFGSDKEYKSWNVRFSNKKAGCYSSNYASVKVDTTAYPMQRIIFLMHHGYLPKVVDHIDCNPMNNKIENLRAATYSQNKSNQRLPSHNTSGYKGVCWNKVGGKWRAHVKIKGKKIYLGLYPKVEDAAKVAALAREALHGEFARHK